MASLSVKCAGILLCTGKEYEFVAKAKLNVSGIHAGPVSYEIDPAKEHVLEAPTRAVILERERPRFLFSFWEDELTKRRVYMERLVLSPPQPNLQKWWINYKETPPPLPVELAASLTAGLSPMFIIGGVVTAQELQKARVFG